MQMCPYELSMEINFPKLEKKILKFWLRNKIFEKSIEQRKRTRNFIFYEGPPTANGKPGIHHVLSRIFKDIICRYKTMRGFKVERKAGWDTHGLPVELEIEKKLGLKNKKDIEKYGIDKFNKKCKASVWQYKKEWEGLTKRIGFWLDTENAYITYNNNYIESVWWILKKIYQKGLLYKDYKIVPHCPRCGTSLSSHEVAQGYKTVKENSIYIKFPVQNKPNTYFLVWTTTPWTLPANVALAIGKEITYTKVLIKNRNEIFILAKERLKILGEKYEILEEMKGKELKGAAYEKLYESSLTVLNGETVKLKNNNFKVYLADFVSIEEGTGIVHIAPAFGEDDMNLGKKESLSMPITVDLDGAIIKGHKIPGEGLFVKAADYYIIEDLKKRNLLFKEENYEHDYPFCWRCSSPLLYYAKESWFINMQKVKEELINNNQKINWIPSHLKEGRFGEWLKEIKDWAISRERYWGTPLPIWQCKKCQKIETIGSLKELLSQKFSNNSYFLFRHGHSLRQVKNVTNCWPERHPFPLTKKGIKEVKNSAQKIKKYKIDLIFSSDLLRTKQTAEIISKETGAKIIFDKRLREYNVGIFNGKNPKLIWNYLIQSKNIILTKPKGGESLLDIRKRLISFIKEVNKKYQDKKIVIVSHEFPLTILESILKGWSLEKTLEYRSKNRESIIKTGSFRKTEFKMLPLDEDGKLDLHRPYVDDIEFYCQKCNSKMKRVPEVIDCWFDSGSMPFAQHHYPFENQKFIDNRVQFPADYIAEAIDQTRGWFYTLLAVSTLLGFGTPYKNVISLGHVLDEKGEKMSKSKGNVVNPWDVIEKYGIDAVRWYFYTINQPGDSKLFSEKDIEESLRKFILTLWNCYVFFETYVSKREISKKPQIPKTQNILDKWVISELNNLILEVTDTLDRYDITSAARLIENFVINDLSLWFIRRSRRRFQKPENKKELHEASITLKYVLIVLIKLTSPFIPFLSEEIYQKIFNFQFSIFKSVHLEDWPKANRKLINNNLEKKMKRVREIVALALGERVKAGIKVRQPLQKLKIKSEKIKINKELINLIKDEVNVKEVVFDFQIKGEVELDTQITPELKEEGIIREIIRNIQEIRKEKRLKPTDKILVYFSGENELNDFLIKNKKIITKEAKIKDLILDENFSAEKTIKVEDKNLKIGIKKI